jgi:hypothetical protein
MANKKPSEVTVRDAALLLGKRLDDTYKLVQAERLRGRKANGRWRIRVSSIEAYQESAKRRRMGLTRKALRTPTFVPEEVVTQGAS